MKLAHVALIGRPNVGKSTLLNVLVGQKVSIISEKPQTTRSEIIAFFEDERGQLFFHDTPGFYQSSGAVQFNQLIKQTAKGTDLVVYVVDRTRDWGEEEERVWHMIETLPQKKLLVINKIDIKSPDHSKSYQLLISPKVEATIEISAFERQHVKKLVNTLFALANDGVRDTTVDYFPTPLISQTGNEFLAELVREKILAFMNAEIPYQTSVRITKVDDSKDDMLYIQGIIVVSNDHHKPMIIGANGRKIAQITKATEYELKIATGKRIVVKLTVKTRDEMEEAA